MTKHCVYIHQTIDLKMRNCFRVKRTVLISRPVTCSIQRRSCRTFLSISCAAVVLVAELTAMPRVTYARADAHSVPLPLCTHARADANCVALPLVRSRQSHLMVRAFINGKEAWLTIDSGAPVSAIALNRRNYLRLKPITAKSNLPSRVQINGAFNNVAIARELRLGGLTLIDEPVVTVDLGNSARAARLVH